TVFAKLGEKGVVIVDYKSTSAVYLEGYKVKVKDTTSAGDSFAGALALKLVKGKSNKESALYANTVGALTVTRYGSQRSIPSKEEAELFNTNVDHFIKSHRKELNK